MIENIQHSKVLMNLTNLDHYSMLFNTFGFYANVKIKLSAVLRPGCASQQWSESSLFTAVRTVTKQLCSTGKTPLPA